MPQTYFLAFSLYPKDREGAFAPTSFYSTTLGSLCSKLPPLRDMGDTRKTLNELSSIPLPLLVMATLEA